MTTFLMSFRRFPTTFRRFPKIFQNCPEGQTNVPEHFPMISENFRRCPKIAEDFRGRPEDVSMIHQRISVQFKRQTWYHRSHRYLHMWRYHIFTCEDIVSLLSIYYHSLYHWLFIFTRWYFQPEIGRKKRILSLDRKNNVLIKKSVIMISSLCKSHSEKLQNQSMRVPLDKF